MNKITPEAKQLGDEGEALAIKLLKVFGFKLSRPDYSGHREGEPRLFYGEMVEEDEDIEFEIKTKSEPFVGPPFDGHGADIYQIEKRLRRYKKHKLRQFFLVIEAGGDAYGQWLHRLEEGPKFDTENNIRIYPLSRFVMIPNIFIEGLGDDEKKKS